MKITHVINVEYKNQYSAFELDCNELLQVNRILIYDNEDVYDTIRDYLEDKNVYSLTIINKEK